MNHFTVNHLRSVRALVLVAESHVQAIEQLLNNASALHHINLPLTIINDLDQQQLGQVSRQLAEVKSVLQAFAKAYAINPEEKSLKKMVNVKALNLWEDLSGAGFDKLIGYGEINEADREEYESFIGPLEQLSKQLIKTTN